MYIMLSQTVLETLSACAASKVLAAVLTYPCQTVRACQQAQTATGAVAANPTTVGSILKSQGVRGLYRGLAPYLLHVVPNVCVVFVVYEAVVGGR